MSRFLLMIACFGLGSTGALTACTPVSSSATKTEPVISGTAVKETPMEQSVKIVGNTARDGQIAIKEEFDAAMKANTKAALDFFIKRHPNSQWTPTAKAQRAVLD